MTAGVCACMFSNKVNGAGRQDGGTDGLTLDGFKEVGWAALLHLLFLLASLGISHGVKKVWKQYHGG